MTKTQFTAGEWEITATGGDVMTPGTSDILIGNGELWIARLFHPNSHVPGTVSLAPPDGEVRANARLIATAPQMYAALQGIADSSEASPVIVEMALSALRAAVKDVISTAWIPKDQR